MDAPTRPVPSLGAREGAGLPAASAAIAPRGDGITLEWIITRHNAFYVKAFEPRAARRGSAGRCGMATDGADVRPGPASVHISHNCIFDERAQYYYSTAWHNHTGHSHASATLQRNPEKHTRHNSARALKRQIAGSCASQRLSNYPRRSLALLVERLALLTQHVGGLLLLLDAVLHAVVQLALLLVHHHDPQRLLLLLLRHRRGTIARLALLL